MTNPIFPFMINKTDKKRHKGGGIATTAIPAIDEGVQSIIRGFNRQYQGYEGDYTTYAEQGPEHQFFVTLDGVNGPQVAPQSTSPLADIASSSGVDSSIYQTVNAPHEEVKPLFAPVPAVKNDPILDAITRASPLEQANGGHVRFYS
jgi:hypothetical protein